MYLKCSYPRWVKIYCFCTYQIYQQIACTLLLRQHRDPRGDVQPNPLFWTHPPHPHPHHHFHPNHLPQPQSWQQHPPGSHVALPFETPWLHHLHRWAAEGGGPDLLQDWDGHWGENDGDIGHAGSWWKSSKSKDKVCFSSKMRLSWSKRQNLPIPLLANSRWKSLRSSLTRSTYPSRFTLKLKKKKSTKWKVFDNQ